MGAFRYVAYRHWYAYVWVCWCGLVRWGRRLS